MSWGWGRKATGLPGTEDNSCSKTRVCCRMTGAYGIDDSSHTKKQSIKSVSDYSSSCKFILPSSQNEILNTLLCNSCSSTKQSSLWNLKLDCMNIPHIGVSKAINILPSALQSSLQSVRMHTRKHASAIAGLLGGDPLKRGTGGPLVA